MIELSADTWKFLFNVITGIQFRIVKNADNIPGTPPWQWLAYSSRSRNPENCKLPTANCQLRTANCEL